MFIERSAGMHLEPKIKNYINSHLRQIFKWSSQYKICKSHAQIDGEIYRCDGCKTLIDKKGKDGRETLNGERVFAEALFVDHVDPVVPITGWYGDDHYAELLIKRMFPGNDGLQYLCQCCHYLKTQYENNIRRKTK